MGDGGIVGLLFICCFPARCSGAFFFHFGSMISLIST